ncbi:hypothetical protein BH23CYA1_BH23CYA1_23130 [soil metagenome]
MTGELGYSLPPAIRRIATNFRLAGWIGLWAQAVIGVVASGLFVIYSLEPETGPGEASAGIFTAIGIVTAFVSAFWGFRYTRLARKLRNPNPDLRPKPKDAARAIRIGLIISLVGMLVTILGTQSIVGPLLLRGLRQGPVVIGATRDSSAFINAADIAVVCSATNTIFAHYIGLCCSLWLQYVVNR